MPRLPQVSGHALIQLLRSLGYEILRQRGSHVRLRKVTVIGEHNITVPNHPVLAKGITSTVLSLFSGGHGMPCPYGRSPHPAVQTKRKLLVKTERAERMPG